MKAELVVIQNRADYEAALQMLRSLMDASDSRSATRLRAQATLIAAWEAEQRPPRPVDPIEAIKFRMEQMGLKRADLVKVIGSKSKVSEVLSRKRPLSLSMIRRLRKKLQIPADVLISDAA